MRLTVLGCAGSMPGPDSPCSAYLLEAEDFRLLIDFGIGAIGALQREQLLHDIDAIVLSHLHLDHCADAASYIIARHYYPPNGEPLPKIPLHAPAGAAARIAEIGGAGVGSHAAEVFEFRTMLRGELEIGPFTINLAHVNHPIETFGMRIEHAGRVFTYSGDTGESDTLIDLARNADLFLCEASFDENPNNPLDVHLSGSQAGQHAMKAAARKLLLTHLVSPHVDENEILEVARRHYTGQVELARAGWVYDI
jgi:ribonuclease BN (tRNA processing enzyme)